MCDVVIDIVKDNFPRFVNCYKLDKTIGKRQMHFINIPNYVKDTDLVSAIKEQIGHVISVEVIKYETFDSAAYLVDVKIPDCEFNKLWNIKCMDTTIKREDNNSNPDHLRSFSN